MATTPADACLCEAREYWGLLAPENGRLPANAAGVAWHKPGESVPHVAILAQVSVEARQDGVSREVPATVRDVPGFPGVYSIGPRDGLIAGLEYRFTDRGERSAGVPRQVVATVDAASLEPPTSLTGQVWPLYSETIAVADGGGSCWVAQWVTQALIEATLPQTAGHWRDQLLYRTLVDGEPWYAKSSVCDYHPPGRNWRETGEDLVYSACPAPSGDSPSGSGFAFGEDRRRRRLEPSRHTVQMQAFLPGTDIVLETETLPVDLSCTGPVEP